MSDRELKRGKIVDLDEHIERDRCHHYIDLDYVPYNKRRWTKANIGLRVNIISTTAHCVCR